jgi:hypothetical protein
MLEIDYELNIKRSKSISRYQQYQAYVDSLNSINVDKNDPMKAQIAGRSVTQINGSSSRETNLYQTHLNSTKEDRLLQNFVNTLKKTEQL